MSEEIQRELMKGGVVDITTRGRRTGEPRRIEIRLHVIDDEIYLTGSPGPRSWHANLLSYADFRLHLKRELVADLDAHATEVTGNEETRRVHRRILENVGKPEELELRVKGSPLMHIRVDTDSATS
ncbi:MAG: nitroreductase/quinone reductase family protein [Chloroflexi bacterium]|nr:nitroreductase/quinone reductase family protein [Chloroflexota bacterium]MDA1173002.1 nitroreductase/quinone reductase family protein [Chloroflexota bacterium]